MNTGEALVSLGARPALGEAMVAGDVVNTASRLQQAARVNGVIVGSETYASTRDAIHYEPADPVEAKGKSRPVEAWIAIEPLGAGWHAQALGGAGRPQARARHAARDLGARVERARSAPRDRARPRGDRQDAPGPGVQRDRRGSRRPQRPRPLAAVPGEQRLLRLRDAGQAALRHLRERPVRGRPEEAAGAGGRGLFALGRRHGDEASCDPPRVRPRGIRRRPRGAVLLGARASSRRLPPTGRPCSFSRTSTGPTAACST